ncbi:polyprenyl diphosphate synthase [Candidatus Endowatersipora endosymbiont of Watersipora subatra]|uniref:polyprenyl diphosphate synthase n=1 Tax=Candidatus Endowatersipora endosymbiont of Watersipora subatra TaxID=3077946 RepID=UPI00312C73B5
MDGNGRWAQSRGLPRSSGHKKGVDAVRSAIRTASEWGVKTLTLFSFSSENWKRPKSEVNDLMCLLKSFIRRDLSDLHKEDIKVCVIGARKGIPSDVLPLLQEAENLTCNNSSTRLVIAFNYSGREEIVYAAKELAKCVAKGEISSDEITEHLFSRALYTAEWSDPDLIIRTSGELRLSNFLLWQAAYSEFVFLDCLWPDFDQAQFEHALSEFDSRIRRFGSLVRNTVT